MAFYIAIWLYNYSLCMALVPVWGFLRYPSHVLHNMKRLALNWPTHNIDVKSIANVLHA